MFVMKETINMLYLMAKYMYRYNEAQLMIELCEHIFFMLTQNTVSALNTKGPWISYLRGPITKYKIYLTFSEKMLTKFFPLKIHLFKC